MRQLIPVFALAATLVMQSQSLALAADMVPPGNRNAEQPAIPGASVRRTKAGKTSFDAKYDKVRDLLANDGQLMGKIKATAAKYGINPIHMVGAIVGEHTYNVDAYDRLQSYYVKAASYTGSFRFAYDGENVADFVARPEFAKCADKKGSYRQEGLLRAVDLPRKRLEPLVQGRDGRRHVLPQQPLQRGVLPALLCRPDLRPRPDQPADFFQPFYAGQTFGLGQINPLTALTLTDDVARISGYDRLDENDAAGVYKAIMDPDISLAYMAASIRRSIDAYKKIAGVDISKNPGLTATLYKAR